PPLHPGADPLDPAHRQGRPQDPPRGDRRRRAEPVEPGAGLPLRGALPVRDAGLHHGDAAIAPDRAGPQGRLRTMSASQGGGVNDRDAGEPLLRVRNLVKYYPVKRRLLSREVERVHAVDGASFEINAGETLGLVGESGCGKSTTGRCILRLIEPTAGEIWFDGKEVTALSGGALRALCRDMQIIFQDPYASLDPRMTVGAIIGEALIIHNLAKNRREFEDRVVELLETVGLNA